MDDIIFGRKPVLDALRSGSPAIHKIMIGKDSHGSAIEAIKAGARQQGIPFKFVPTEKLNRSSPQPVNHQGVVAQVAAASYAELSDVLARPGARFPLIILLDGIQDVHNLGAIIRTAAAVNAECVIIPRHNAAGLTATVYKTSAGAVSHIPIVRMKMFEAIQKLKDNGYWVAGLSAHAKASIFTPQAADRALALILGTEEKDLSSAIRKRCDFLFNIPIWGHINSLNASNAAAVAMYEIRRQQLFISSPDN